MRVTRLLLACATAAIVSAESAQATCPGNWGTALASYRGVTAYSNGSDIECWDGSSAYGYRYQCVEYTERFFGEAMHFSSTTWTGNGAAYYGSAETKGLRQFPQGGTTKPKENDILCFSGGGAGHVGIITEVWQDEAQNHWIKMIDQNRTTTGGTENPKTLALNVNGDTYSVTSFNPSSYPVQGWLRGYTSDYFDQTPATAITLNPGQAQLFRVRFKNTSRPNAPHWKNDGGVHSIELRSCNSQGVETSSFLYPADGQPGWLDPVNRKRIVRMSETDVGTDGIATFEFWAKVPEGAAPNTYPVYFRPYHESGEWIEEWDGVHFVITVTSPILTGTTFQALSGRFNSDSYADIGLYQVETGSWHVAFRDPTSHRYIPQPGPWLTGWAIGPGYAPLVGDFTGDGLTDICVHHAATGEWYVARNTGSSFVNMPGPIDYPNRSWIYGWAQGTGGGWTWTPLAGDFNADGRTDIAAYHHEPGRWYVALNQGDRFVHAPGPYEYTSWLTGWAAGNGLTALTGNFSGDGYTDIGCYNPAAGQWFVAFNQGSSFVHASGPYANESWIDGWAKAVEGHQYTALTGQFAGDGLTDILAYEWPVGEWYVARNIGSSFQHVAGPGANTSWIDNWAREDGVLHWQPLVADYSGDEVADILAYTPTTGSWWAAENWTDVFHSVAGPFTDYAILRDWGKTTSGGGYSMQPAPPDEGQLPGPIAFGLWTGPNPARGGTTIRYALPSASRVTLAVYDLAGKRVALLVDGPESAGEHRVAWDATGLPPGVYFYELTAGTTRARGRTVLLK